MTTIPVPTITYSHNNNNNHAWTFSHLDHARALPLFLTRRKITVTRSKYGGGSASSPPHSHFRVSCQSKVNSSPPFCASHSTQRVFSPQQFNSSREQSLDFCVKISFRIWPHPSSWRITIYCFTSLIFAYKREIIISQHFFWNRI